MFWGILFADRVGHPWVQTVIPDVQEGDAPPARGDEEGPV
mgnify:FL=1